jgi:hypothetical protein
VWIKNNVTGKLKYVRCCPEPIQLLSLATAMILRRKPVKNNSWRHRLSFLIDFILVDIGV